MPSFVPLKSKAPSCPHPHSVPPSSGRKAGRGFRRERAFFYKLPSPVLQNGRRVGDEGITDSFSAAKIFVRLSDKGLEIIFDISLYFFIMIIMKNNLYLDTTIPSSFFDTSKPIRQLITQKWFEYDAINYNLCISVITIREISKIINPIKKYNIEKLIYDNDMKLLEFNEEAKILAEKYMEKGAIPKSEPEDAYHIAIATVNKIEFLASWNFSHIVSVNPIRKIHEINLSNKYDIIEINSLEIYGGYKYGNL